MVHRLFTLILSLFAFCNVWAETPSYTVKVGEVVKLEITSSARSILSWSTGKYGKWDVNRLELELLDYSWDYAYVRGLRETSLSSVQLTVTHNHNGIYGDKYYMPFHVRVIANGPSSISVSPSNLTLTEGDTYTLRASITGSSGSYTWSSSDDRVAMVSGDGLSGRIVARESGRAYVTVRTNTGKSSTCRVDVNRKIVKPTSISLPDSKSVFIGESTNIKASVYPYDAIYSLSWSSSDNSIATVSASGRVEGKSEGRVKITAKVNGSYLSDYCWLTVRGNKLKSLSITKELNMNVGDKFLLQTQYSPLDVITDFIWKSSDVDVVAVSQNGEVTALGEGKATVELFDKISGLSATCQVLVTQKVVVSEKIVLPDSITLTVGEFADIKAEVSPSDALYSLSWSSADTSIVTVTTSGRVYGKSSGRVQVTAKVKDSNLFDVCWVKVVGEKLETLSLPETVTLNIGERYMLKPHFAPQNAEKELYWTSGAKNIVSVSQTGEVVALEEGVAKIVVRDRKSGLLAMCSVKVVSDDAVSKYDWIGTFRVKADVEFVSGNPLEYPSEFDMEVELNEDNKVIITKFLKTDYVYDIVPGLSLEDKTNGKNKIIIKDNFLGFAEFSSDTMLQISSYREIDKWVDDTLRIDALKNGDVGIEEFKVEYVSIDYNTDEVFSKPVVGAIYRNLIAKKIDCTSIPDLGMQSQENIKISIVGHTIFFDKICNVKIFRMDGSLFYSGSGDRVCNLQRGVYLVKINGQSRKVMVR